MVYFDKFLGLYPQNSLASYVLREKGNLLMSQKKWREAIEVFTKVPEENRVLDAELLFKIGDCLQNLKRPEEALHSYLKIITFYDDIAPWNKKAEKVIAEIKKKPQVNAD